ncbi:AAA family ATPase [uncultured Prevotella sp.]|uniref:AAA family ATPase n=1 Tax=uncultured Prevotella sp. TaxID=159272 RepID=UPI0025E31FE5|nr:AAA family ATPase [uncultured Prevotella sp.]
MAEASPICRGKNLTIETVLAFINAMPLMPMKKSLFHSKTEEKLKGWTQTHSQIARQLALYYEKDGICYPRFTNVVSYIDVLKYVMNWAKLYFVPNIYTPSLLHNNYVPTNIYAFLKAKYNEGVNSYVQACEQIFGIELNNLDKVRVYLNNFTDIVINDETMSINVHLNDTFTPEVYPNLNINTAEDYFNYFNIENTICSENNKVCIIKGSLQQIFYGAPGTGKSHTIKEQTKGEDVVRTTFHPDSDYSTFVGAYKPTTKTVPVTTVIGTKAVAVEDENGKPMTEEKIVYEFVSQAFLQAYVEAWKKLAKPNIDDTVDKEYLIIEEINRGNCAQIFGDLFQLLDRGDHGFSEYPIKADADMQKQLKKAFAGITIPQAKEINGLFKDENDIVSQVLNGEILLLPNNLYIWATMNTSDQSLFPIDSAFKRRWDWQYVPICDARKDWTIEVGENKYDWWVFLSKINTYIYDATFSEDKKLGYFFCKAENGVISAEKFVSKVIFYLWNDVFKDTEFDGDAFRDENGGKLSFDKFYLDMNGLTKVNEDKVGQFLRNLDIMPISNESVTE